MLHGLIFSSLLGIVINVGGEPDGSLIGGQYWRDPGPTKNGFKGFCNVLVSTTFAFNGPELVGLAAAETANPRKSIPSAFDQVSWRITLCYLFSFMVIGLLISSDDSRLLGTEPSASPFVIAIERAGPTILPQIMVVIILLTYVSVGNTAIFASSRLLNGLAHQSHAPQIFTYIDRQGRPLVAIIVASCFGITAFIADLDIYSDILSWFLSISTLSTLFVWASICLCHIRFRRAMADASKPLHQIPFQSKVGLWGSWFGLAGCGWVFLAQVWIAISPISLETAYTASIRIKVIFLNLTALPIVLICYFGHKLWFRTRVIRISEIDIDTGRRYIRTHITAEEEKKDKLNWPSLKAICRFFF